MAALWLFVSSAVCLIGAACLAISQRRHWPTITGERRSSPPTVSGVWVGWALVLASIIPCVLVDGAAFAVLLWTLLAGAVAMLVSLALTFRPHSLRAAARALAACEARLR